MLNGYTKQHEQVLDILRNYRIKKEELHYYSKLIFYWAKFKSILEDENLYILYSTSHTKELQHVKQKLK